MAVEDERCAGLRCEQGEGVAAVRGDLEVFGGVFRERWCEDFGDDDWVLGPGCAAIGGGDAEEDAEVAGTVWISIKEGSQRVGEAVGDCAGGGLGSVAEEPEVAGTGG